MIDPYALGCEVSQPESHLKGILQWNSFLSPLECEDIVIILHDAHMESFPCIMLTFSHKLCVLMVAIAPSDL